jgi:hypothetical protein
MFRFVAAFLVSFVALQAHAADAPTIDWRVEHPFRYFIETKDFDMHREAMAEVMQTSSGALSASAVSDLEKLVNDPRWLREWYEQNPKLYPDRFRAGRPERGWANQINRRRATCWDSRQQWHSSCTSDSFGRALRTDYVLPQTHGVLLSVITPPAGVCHWSAATKIFVNERGELASEIDKPCGEAVKSRIPFKPDVPEEERGVDVSVILPGEEPRTTLTVKNIWVRDRLIAGIGDSYSSGEGNPDSPVEIDPFSHRRHLNMSFVYDDQAHAIRSNPAYSLPVRSQNIPAGWLDRKCHRSAYSYHLRTALQVALADPKHSAVTFLGFACSGAEITEGLLCPDAGVETVEPSYFRGGGVKRRNMPQLDRLMIELCRDDLTLRRPKNLRLDQPVLNPATNQMVREVPLLSCPPGRYLRPLDLLIISIGGNDVGFTPLIVDVLTKRPPPYATPESKFNADRLGASVIRYLARQFRGHNVREAKKKALQLPARFAALRKALDPVPVRADAEGRRNIVLTAFPKVEFNEDGTLCGESDPRERLEGFNVGGVLAINVPTLQSVSQFANNTLYPATKEAAQAGNWHFVDAHRGPFLTHGICAQKRSSPVSNAENLMLPYYHSVKNQADRWSDYNPVRETRAYASRQRWFRTLNDICLFVQYKAKGSPPPPENWGLVDMIEACLGGPFHPTAEGHAHIADAVYDQVKTILNLPQPDVSEVRPR